MSPKGLSFIFLKFCNRMDVQKIPKGPPFTFFGTMRPIGDFKKTFEIFFHFLFRGGALEENTLTL